MLRAEKAVGFVFNLKNGSDSDTHFKQALYNTNPLIHSDKNKLCHPNTV